MIKDLPLGHVKTFSIGFEEREFSELEYAKAVAERYGADHTEFVVKPEMPEVLPKLARHYGEANSLEGRSPFLDHEFVELASTIPGDWKLRGVRERGTRHLLEETFAGDLPPRILRRGKMGFSVPLGDWFRGGLKSYWEEIVLSPDALRRGRFDEKALRRLWVEHESRHRDHGYKLSALLTLELWNLECGG